MRKTIVVALTALLSMPPLAAQEGTSARVVRPHAAVINRTLGEWSAIWWKWAYGIPVTDNPVLDTTGAKAKFGDVGPVFFLAGAFTSGTVHRTATVPAEKFIFFPVLNSVNDNVGVSSRVTIDVLSGQLADALPLTTELHASVDGVAVPNLFTHREISPVFSYTLQLTDNVQQDVFGNHGPDAVGTVFPAVADGFYLMLKPLSPGHHVINFGGSSPGLNFIIDVTYDITVTPTEVEQPAVLVP